MTETHRTDLEPAAAAAVAVNPATGQTIELAAARVDELFDELELTGDLASELGNHRRRLELELARRADALNERTVTLDGCDYTVNAPTEDVVDVADLRAEIARFTTAAEVALEAGDEVGHARACQRAELLRGLITYPPPAKPAPRVDKRAYARLAKSDDRELLGALAAARRRVPTKRTVKLKARAVNATAEEA